MNNIEQQIKAMIIFVDIRGFGSFIRRVNYPVTEFLPFWRNWKEAIDKFQDETGYFVKRLGDGLMAVKEMPDRNQSQVAADVIIKTWELANKLDKLISQKYTPRPDGIRIRETIGYVWKVLCRQYGWDYIGDKVNLTEKMVHRYEDELFVCDESVPEMFSKHQKREHGFKFTKLINSGNALDGIYQKDMSNLYSFKKSG